jgi:hypothetical protein
LGSLRSGLHAFRVRLLVVKIVHFLAKSFVRGTDTRTNLRCAPVMVHDVYETGLLYGGAY